jgi:serine protease Do
MKKFILVFFVLPVFTAISSAAVQYIPASFKNIAEKVRPSVVNISTVSIIRVNGDSMSDPFFNDEFYRRFFGAPQRQMKRQSLGSGFIVSRDGFILTNNHVVEKADEITVKLYNQQEYKAKVIGTDKDTDLAVIKIEADNLTPIFMGDSDKIDVGDWVLAVGSPFGLEQTVTQGIISAKGRIIGEGPYDDFLQTDAAINPGNSGGPLINMNGEVIGINTAISSTSGGYEGVGFAMPINMAKKTYNDIIKRGRVIRGWLGVGIQEMTPALAKHFKVAAGVLISQVYAGGPADAGGLKSGDVVVSIDSKPVKKYRELQSIVADEEVGKTVAINVIRNGKEETHNVKIAERNMAKFVKEQKQELAKQAKKDFGIGVGDISAELSQQYSLSATSGVVVLQVEANSPADNAGIQPGDVIHEMNGRRIKNTSDFDGVAAKIAKGTQVVLLIERGDTMVYLAFTNE